MTEIFAYYNLKSDVNIEEYKQWSYSVDQPTCKSMDGCESFEVFLVKRVANGQVFYDVTEKIIATSWERWHEILKSPEFDQVNREWPNYGDAESLVITECEKV
jgi:hypothetical protein